MCRCMLSIFLQLFMLIYPKQHERQVKKGGFLPLGCTTRKSPKACVLYVFSRTTDFEVFVVVIVCGRRSGDR